MSIREVVGYRAHWDLVKHSGSVGVTVKLQSGSSSHDFPVGSVQELDAVLTLLRNEKPVHFNDADGAATIMIGWSGMEAVGEAEK